MHEHQPTCLQETLQKWVKKRKAEEVTRAEPEPKAIPRYGRLLKTYYPLLELLPTAALPPRPPSGKHQFTLKWSNSRDVPVPVQIICDLRGSWRVVHKNRTRTFVFYDDNICNAWNLAKETASYWESHPPHPREHDKPEPAAAARESREGEGHSSDDTDSFDLGPFADAFDDESLDRLLDSSSEAELPDSEARPRRALPEPATD